MTVVILSCLAILISLCSWPLNFASITRSKHTIILCREGRAAADVYAATRRYRVGRSIDRWIDLHISWLGVGS